MDVLARENIEKYEKVFFLPFRAFAQDDDDGFRDPDYGTRLSINAMLLGFLRENRIQCIEIPVMESVDHRLDWLMKYHSKVIRAESPELKLRGRSHEDGDSS